MSKKPKFHSPTGMHDILPEEQRYFQKIYSVCDNIANFYNFQKIDTPILEDTELFSKGIGLATDIVQKQMYSFRTKGRDFLTLRPEGTAPVVRAFIQHGMYNLPQPVKLWYFAPFFRYEKPQAGRYRQFWQFGFETLGEKSPIIDAQLIQICYNILKELKFKDLFVEVNSIGDSQCRPYYKKILVGYFRSRETSLCGDCRRRLKENPMRILDCKEEKCQLIKAGAPQSVDHLCEECKAHFKEVLEFLEEIELPYYLNPHLVRGLDYYTKTVFEFFERSSSFVGDPSAISTKNDQEPNNAKEESVEQKLALSGGGRYDALVKILGGKEIPAAGFAAGIERIVETIKKKTSGSQTSFVPQIFLAQLGPLGKRKSLKILEEFRKEKIFVLESLGRDSLKAQLNRADKLGIKHTLILGQKEALEGKIILRDMERGKQEIVELEKVVKKMKQKLKSKN